MPIKGLTGRDLQFAEVGVIRKGAAKEEKETKAGKKYSTVGRDLTYFRVEFGEGYEVMANLFKANYGAEPNAINIVLPFDDLDMCWEAWNEAYTRGRMVARSDGEFMIYQINPKNGDVLVREGEPRIQEPIDRIVGTYKTETGEEPIKLEPVGRLKVVIPELRNLVYLTVITNSLHDIKNIDSQLRAIQAFANGKMAGIPMILRRSPKMISVPKPGGQRARYKKYMLSIETNPKWTSAMLTASQNNALPGSKTTAALPALTAADIEVPEQAATPTVQETPVVEMSEEEIQQLEKEENTSDEHIPSTPVAAVDLLEGEVMIGRKPEIVKTYILKLVPTFAGFNIDQQDISRIVTVIKLSTGEIQKNVDVIQAIFNYIFGKKESLTASEWKAMDNYLEAKSIGDHKWDVKPEICNELVQIYMASKAPGQGVLGV